MFYYQKNSHLSQNRLPNVYTVSFSIFLRDLFFAIHIKTCLILLGLLNRLLYFWVLKWQISATSFLIHSFLLVGVSDSNTNIVRSILKRYWILLVVLKRPWIRKERILDFFIRSWKVFEIYTFFSVKLDYFAEENLAHPRCNNHKTHR